MISKSLSPQDIRDTESDIVESSNSKTRVAAEGELQREIKKRMKERLECDGKVVNRMINTYHNQSLAEEVANDDDFVAHYTLIFDKEIEEQE